MGGVLLLKHALFRGAGSLAGCDWRPSQERPEAEKFEGFKANSCSVGFAAVVPRRSRRVHASLHRGRMCGSRRGAGHLFTAVLGRGCMAVSRARRLELFTVDSNNPIAAAEQESSPNNPIAAAEQEMIQLQQLNKSRTSDSLQTKTLRLRADSPLALYVQHSVQACKSSRRSDHSDGALVSEGFRLFEHATLCTCPAPTTCNDHPDAECALGDAFGVRQRSRRWSTIPRAQG